MKYTDPDGRAPRTTEFTIDGIYFTKTAFEACEAPAANIVVSVANKIDILNSLRNIAVKLANTAKIANLLSMLLTPTPLGDVDFPQDVHYNEHHVMPKYLGGPDITSNKLSIPKQEHVDLHRDMNTFFKSDPAYNKLVPSRTNRGIEIQRLDEQFLLQAVANFYMMYKDKYPVEAAKFFELYPDTLPEAIRYCEAHPHYNIYARYNMERTPE